MADYEVGKNKPPKKTRFKKGQSGNPNGRKKGTIVWSTMVKHLLEDENLADKMLKSKPQWWTDLADGDKNMAAAIAGAMIAKAASGDEKAARWVRQTGFGDKVDITSGDMPIPILGVHGVQDNDSPDEDSEA